MENVTFLPATDLKTLGKAVGLFEGTLEINARNEGQSELLFTKAYKKVCMSYNNV